MELGKKIVIAHLAMVVGFLILTPLFAIGYTYLKNSSYKELRYDTLVQLVKKQPVQTITKEGNKLFVVTQNQNKFYSKANTEQSLALANYIHYNALPYTKPTFISKVSVKENFRTTYLPFLILFFLFTLPFIWIMALIDLVGSKFANKHKKLKWFVWMFIVPIITPYCYACIHNRQKKIFA